MGCIVNSSEISRQDKQSIYLDDGNEVYITHNESVYIEEVIPTEDCVAVDITFDVTKAKEDEGLVSGWANVAVNADGSIPLDWQGDIIRPETLEKAAINFMLEYRGSGVMHQGESQGTVVESIVFTKEKQVAIGIPEGTVPEGWFITVKVTNPEVFAGVKSGKYRMFSIQGSSKRVAI